MKKILLLLCLLTSINIYSQLDQFPRPGEGMLNGGLGLNWIDGELFYTFHLMPEVSFANFGAGLDLRLDVNSKGNLRKENFNEFSDYLSIIRYVRYGLKNDPVYVKLGALDYYTLGHGSIMYQYNNSPSFDSRKTGLVFDIDFGSIGFESIYGSFAEAGVFGIRGYVRPLQFTTLGSIPVIGNLEVGASYAADFNKYAGVVYGNYNDSTNQFSASLDKGAINIVGFDLGLPIVSTGTVAVKLYMDYAKIIDYGSGVSTGIMGTFNGLGLVTAQARLERRFNGEKYIPSYFNSLYEVDRFRTVPGAAGGFVSKAEQLNFMTSNDNGYFGELGISILHMFDIIGSYQRLDKTPESGILHLKSEVAPEEAPFLVRFGYDKTNIKDEKDLFTLDERSFAYFEAGYKPMPYLLVSLLTSWTFGPVRDNDDKIIGYEPQKRIEPRVSFIYPFNVNGGK